MKNDDILLGSYHAIDVSEVDYTKLPDYIEQAKSFARITASCVFVIDYCKGNIPFASSHMLDEICTDEMMNDSYAYFSKRMLYDEMEKFKEISRASFDFIHQQPAEDRINFTLSFGFHLIEDNVRLLMFRHITPMALSKNGDVWLMIGTITPSSDVLPGFSVLRGKNNEDYYEYDYAEHRFVKRQGIVLDDLERKLLILSSQGYSVEEVARALFKSPDAIRSRKQKIFKMLGVKTITEAIVKARNYMLF